MHPSQKETHNFISSRIISKFLAKDKNDTSGSSLSYGYPTNECSSITASTVTQPIILLHKYLTNIEAVMILLNQKKKREKLYRPFIKNIDRALFGKESFWTKYNDKINTNMHFFGFVFLMSLDTKNSKTEKLTICFNFSHNKLYFLCHFFFFVLLYHLFLERIVLI